MACHSHYIVDLENVQSFSVFPKAAIVVSHIYVRFVVISDSLFTIFRIAFDYEIETLSQLSCAYSVYTYPFNNDDMKIL